LTMKTKDGNREQRIRSWVVRKVPRIFHVQRMASSKTQFFSELGFRGGTG
jgi:hypothetical protein